MQVLEQNRKTGKLTQTNKKSESKLFPLRFFRKWNDSEFKRNTRLMWKNKVIGVMIDIKQQV